MDLVAAGLVGQGRLELHLQHRVFPRQLPQRAGSERGGVRPLRGCSPLLACMALLYQGAALRCRSLLRLRDRARRRGSLQGTRLARVCLREDSRRPRLRRRARIDRLAISESIEDQPLCGSLRQGQVLPVGGYIPQVPQRRPVDGSGMVVGVHDVGGVPARSLRRLRGAYGEEPLLAGHGHLGGRPQVGIPQPVHQRGDQSSGGAVGTRVQRRTERMAQRDMVLLLGIDGSGLVARL